MREEKVRPFSCSPSSFLYQANIVHTSFCERGRATLPCPARTSVYQLTTAASYLSSFITTPKSNTVSRARAP